MNHKTKFDVIVPCYNVEHIVEKSLDSILSQKYPKDKFSVIVIDDGSTCLLYTSPSPRDRG